ncbi:MAG: PSD1 and planctomycete cytochrome C domain-containing protein [Verrucomicrobiota bacterium]
MNVRSLTLFSYLFCLASTEAADFNREVRPILSDKCFACQGPDEHDRKADLRLDTEEGAMEDLGGYAAIVPGNLGESEAWLRIISDDASDVMPPQKAHKDLTSEEKGILKRWIEEGAEFDLHWSFKALERPEVPDPGSAEWGNNEVDEFIFAAQEERGLAPAANADPITLARRVHFDLTGLPPSPESVADFVKDPTAKNYTAMVDRLLKEPDFGERMAVYWLDLVRYADTIGYHSDNPMEVSAYRDYVIDSFNQNLPYDRFTIEQLAGDLLPSPTVQQRVASGYNRLLQTTQEGGAQAKEYIAIHAADRVRNVSGVWLGTTIGCAQCHDHKYDPFSTKDFYSLAAFFADVKEKPIGRRQPNLKLPTAEEESRMADLRQSLSQNTINRVLARDHTLAASVRAEREAWIVETRAQVLAEKETWQRIKPSEFTTKNGSKFKVDDTGLVLIDKNPPTKEVYTVTAAPEGAITGFRLEVLTDPGFPNKAFGRGGNFVLSHVEAQVEGKKVDIVKAQGDEPQNGYPLSHAIDGNPETVGWAGNGHVKADHQPLTAVFSFAEPVRLADAQQLSVVLHHTSHYARHSFGRFRISYTTRENPSPSGGLEVPPAIFNLLAGPEINPEEPSLVAHFNSISPALHETRRNLENWKKELEATEAGIRTMLASEALPEPRVMRILPRGNWLDDSGEEVEPAVPVFLPHEPVKDRRANRLDLANWIVADTNPLTARTFVNRLWKLFFGAGISKNLDDLGGQGVPPSHPELLDWLAVEFQESGWDIKHMVKLLLTSAAYQQSSVETAAMRENDPGNQWLTRQGRWRLEAEFVRDVALDLSGLLVHEKGGISVRPYQPEGYWQHLNFPRREWKADQGDSLYRKGLYTFWCRSFLHPAMLAFDAPSREECTAERARSNIPQQALVLLNDPVFVEASRVFAQRIANQSGDLRTKLNWAWQEAMSRSISSQELLILTEVYESQLASYGAEKSLATELLQVGAAPVPSQLDAGELAAWTQVARTILNAYETTSRN